MSVVTRRALFPMEWGHSLGQIPDEAIEPYEEWIYWLAPHLEKRIIKALTEEGMSF